MEIHEMVKKYAIIMPKEHPGAIQVLYGKAAERDNMIPEIKARKHEIIAFIQEREAAEQKAQQEREDKINAIDGLREYEAVLDAWEEYAYSYQRYITSGAIGKAPVKPAVTADDLAVKYPRAAAYFACKEYQYSENPQKSAAGSKALERILNGEDHETVLREMKKEWDEYVLSRALCD